MISASLDAWLLPSRASQPNTRTMIKYGGPTDTGRDHASTPPPTPTAGLGAGAGTDSGSGAYGPVDTLTQEVRVPVVTAVLEEYVHHHHPQRHVLTPSRLMPGQVQGLGLPLNAARVLDLRLPGRERLSPGRRARVVRCLEVDLVGPDPWRIVVLEHPAEPGTLHLRHVPHQAEQRKRR